MRAFVVLGLVFPYQISLLGVEKLNLTQQRLALGRLGNDLFLSSRT